MEGEVKNFIVVWATVLACLVYCYVMGKFTPKGTKRLLALLPIICLFFFLPLNLTTIHFAGLTSFFITWLANFKLLLFAYGKGPLSSNPANPIPLSRFITTACLPIKTVQNAPPPNSEQLSKFAADHQGNMSREISKKGKKSVWNYGIKVVLVGLLIKVYDYNEYIHPKLRLCLYCLHLYFMLEIILAMVASTARALIQVELEPQFDEPYLATSLQDFWGRRWNIMVSGILHPTVYNPVRSISIRLIPRKWAPLPAVLAPFFVSGVMHELIFYYIGRLKPTGEVMCFFLIHGVSLGIEIAIKRTLNGKFRLPSTVSRLMALGFVLATSFWLFFPPFLRFEPDVKVCKETVAFMEFVLHGSFISPNNTSCPIDLKV